MFKSKLIQRKTARAYACLSLSILFFMILTTLSAAQDYPNRPINIISGTAPGGAHSVFWQIFTENAKKHTPNSQPFVVTFKPGASHTIAAQYVLNQPADGYHVYSYAADLSVKLAKDPSQLNFTKDDFVPIGIMAMDPLCLPVKKDGPFQTLQDFVDYAKKNPGKLSYASAGAGSIVHLVGEVLQERCGIKLNHVPFAGAAPSLTAVLGGHVATYLGTPTASVAANLKPGGQLRLLAVFGKERIVQFPEAPTALEQGYDVVVPTWLGMVARKGTPPQVLDTLREIFKKTGDDPRVKEAIPKMGYQAVNWDPEQTRKEMDAAYEMAKETWARLGLIK